MSKEVKNVKAAAGFFGVVSGCLIGMAPLLFLKRGGKEKEEAKEGEKEGEKEGDEPQKIAPPA